MLRKPKTALPPLEFVSRAKVKLTETCTIRRWRSKIGPYVIAEVKPLSAGLVYYLAIEILEKGEHTIDNGKHHRTYAAAERALNAYYQAGGSHATV